MRLWGWMGRWGCWEVGAEDGGGGFGDLGVNSDENGRYCGMTPSCISYKYGEIEKAVRGTI